jgi:hypothetical protein
MLFRRCIFCELVVLNSRWSGCDRFDGRVIDHFGVAAGVLGKVVCSGVVLDVRVRVGSRGVSPFLVDRRRNDDWIFRRCGGVVLVYVVESVLHGGGGICGRLVSTSFHGIHFHIFGNVTGLAHLHPFPLISSFYRADVKVFELA